MIDNEKKLNVLIVHNYYQIPGGEDTVMENEKQLLEENGNKVYLYTRNNAELKNAGVVSKILLPFTTIFSFRTYLDIRRIIKEKKIDIVHVHNTLNLISPSVYYAAITCRVPVVQTVHNFRFVCPGALLFRSGKICEACIQKGLHCSLKNKCYKGSFLYTLACYVTLKIHRLTGIYRKINYIFLTEFTREKFRETKYGNKIWTDKNTFIKPNFTYSKPESILKKERDCFVYVGRVEEVKGIRLLIDAFCKLENEKLYIIGSGELLSKYNENKEYYEKKNIFFMGFRDRSFVESMLQRAKALIFPSQWYETFGMTIIESYAQGTPVICADQGNYGGLVVEKYTGYKFIQGDVESLLDAISNLNKSDINELGKNAYQVYLEKYSANANYKILREIYFDIL